MSHQAVAPRKNPLLPFVKTDNTGRLTYIRRISAELRPFLGGKATIRRTLATESTDVSSTAVLADYAAVHAEVEALIAEAKQRAALSLAFVNSDSQYIGKTNQSFPLSRRDIAGIAGQVLLEIHEAVANQRGMSVEFSQSLVALALKFKAVGIGGISAADFAIIATPTLNSLGISPTPGDLGQIGEALLRYIPVMQGDMEKLAAFNFSPPKLKAIAPPLPKRQVTWQELIKAWRRSAGGVLEVDGFGVSRERERPYQVTIEEFSRVISNKPPNELTIDDGRTYVRWLKNESGQAPRTQQGRLGAIKNLLKIGVQEGLINSNPFTELKISTPAGVMDQQGYRAFSKQELIQVFTEITSNHLAYQRMTAYILIATGCRLSEAVQLRTSDIKQTQAGVWFIDWKHEPTSALPMLLKTKAQNNRQCPIHKRLIDVGFLEVWQKSNGRLFPNAPTTSSYSSWFKKILKKLGIWEFKKTVLHSIRGSARDLWREAGVPQEFRNALTGHQSRDVGESKYGSGLCQMPDVVYKELSKVNLDWLP